MLRLIAIPTLALMAVIAASAGQIQIGGATGLTNAYVNGNCGGGCITGSALGTYTEANYQTALFSGATNGASTATPFAGYSSSSATPSGKTMVDTANSV